MLIGLKEFDQEPTILREERKGGQNEPLVPVGSVGKFYLESDHLLTMTTRSLIEVQTTSMVYMEANHMAGGLDR